ncbi:MAG: hypothetical protein O7G88_02790 [bacterium]|nr:hypothetical protein [bacterium]
MLKDQAATLYNPHELSKERLIESFVVRTRVFKKLFQDIKNSKMNVPEPHFLIEGQRGSGKTTLLLRLSYEIENDPVLNAWLVPVVFKEEAYYGIFNLAQLWRTTAEILADKDETFLDLVEQMRQPSDEDEDDERLCFELLVNALENHDKKLILCIDNLGEMLQNFSDRESRRIREVLMTCPHLRIVGASSVILEAFFQYKHAFYEFFKPIQLEGLSRDETRMLLLQLAKASHEEETIQYIIANHPGRVESLRTLTGGVIRTIVLLFEIFTDDKDGNSMTDLERVLDGVTPLFKHRMDGLTPQQRPIINAIALNWDALSPAEIASKTHQDIEAVKTIIAVLEKVFIVQRVPTDTQQNLYYLRERFFNIWYLMRVASRRSQSKVIWLVRFLENWYGPEELEKRAKQHIRAVASGEFYPKAAYYLTEALARTGKLDIHTEHQMKTETRRLLLEKDERLAAELSPSDKELFEPAEAYYQNDEYEAAKELFLKIRNKNEYIYFQLGYAFTELQDYPKAEQYYLQAVEHGDTDAMHSLAWFYFERKQKRRDALKYAQRASKAEKSSNHAHTLACIYVWNEQIEDALRIAPVFMEDEAYYETSENDITLYLMLLLAKGQYGYVAEYFEKPELSLKDRLKPLYYALLRLSGNNDYNKMPPELSEPVSQIIERVKQMTVDYA